MENTDYTNVAKKPPMPREKHWLMGHSKGMMGDMLSYLKDVQKECGDIAYLSAPVEAGRMIVLYDTEAIKHIFINNQKNYQKGEFTVKLKPLFGNGLLTSQGDFWKKQRRLIQPVFYKDNIFQMMTGIGQCVDDMVSEWDKKYKDGDEVNLTQEFNHLALRIVAKALFKTEIEKDLPDIADKLGYVLNRIMNRFKNPIVYADWIPTPANKKEKEKTRELFKVIEKLIERKKSGEIPHQNDMLDMLLAIEDEETGEKMSETQVRDELITIMLAGHETTAHAMAYMMYNLSANQEVYQKVDQYIDQHSLTGAPEEIREAEYVRQVVKETLRLCPPAFFYQRQAINDDTINGYHVPAGINVAIPVFVLHRMEKYWENPEAFQPERFEKEAFKKTPKYAYMPFGGGPSLCIGEQFAMSEMMIALIKVHNKFYFRDESNYELEFVPEMSLRPKDPIRLTIYRR
ncbi:MAG: cytochrome P450 [Bacteroidota bacterium]